MQNKVISSYDLHLLYPHSAPQTVGLERGFIHTLEGEDQQEERVLFESPKRAPALQLCLHRMQFSSHSGLDD